ncbi:MAG: CHASE2 domain-containing protein [Candidatus Omnitrophica bacterium]|nr:CHASE2 domain-containing protein [Candidatus Omnitrophota bacterium]MDD5672186.1 CHASE2 domain-containing protein [Candidatus Omnitrophota bacterium]
MPPKKQTVFLHPYVIVPGIAVLLFASYFFNVVDFHETDAVDLRFRLRPSIQVSDIVIVGIDDASIAAVGQWPWPRGTHAVLIDVLSRYAPKLIFFDILFTEPSPDPTEDQTLGYAIQKFGNVLLPFYINSEKPFSAVFPIDLLRKDACGVGFVNMEPERDGVFRKFRPRVRADGKDFYHPSVVIKSLYRGDKPGNPAWVDLLPLDPKGYLWLNFPGALNSFKVVSFAQVIRATGGEQDAEMRKILAGKVVIVGDMATGTTDMVTTPFSPGDPGVFLQASAIHTLLSGRYLRSAPWWLDAVILLILSLWTVWMTRASTPSRGLIILLATSLVYALGNILAFCFLGLIFLLFVPLVMMIFGYGVTLFMKYLEVRLQGELIKRELQTAARIQENFLPQTMPEKEGVDVAFQCHFAKQVGGDLYDWVDLGQGRLGICLGDVSGKGVPAALYMARVVSEFRRENKSVLEPGNVNEIINTILARTGPSGMFLTLHYAVIDTPQRKVRFSSAGQDPMVFYSARQKKAELKPEAQGTPLGLFEESVYETAEFSYEPGDLFVVVSDGVKEMRNPKGEEFGMERVRAFLEKYAPQASNAQDVIQHLSEAGKAFQKGVLPHDDCTIVCVRFV